MLESCGIAIIPKALCSSVPDLKQLCVAVYLFLVAMQFYRIQAHGSTFTLKLTYVCLRWLGDNGIRRLPAEIGMLIGLESL